MRAPPDAPPPPPRSGLRRWLWAVLGWTALGLGIAGIPLPLLPTTPFLILAAACFARSSPELHRRLLAHERLGPYLRQWREDRSVPPRAKRRALVLVAITFAISIALVDRTPLRIALALLGLGLLVFLARLRTAAPPRSAPETLGSDSRPRHDPERPGPPSELGGTSDPR